MLDKQFLAERGFLIEGHKYLELTNEVRNKLIAMDAQPSLNTDPNAGILSALTTYIDPAIVEILFSPFKAAQIAGEEVKKGTWEDTVVAFAQTEYTGSVASYGDFNEDGYAKLNFDFPKREPYLYQTITRWGMLEAARAGRAKINWVSEQDKSSIYILNNFQNKSYFFGVSGLQNYGLLNDPSLQPPIAPIVVGGQTQWQFKDGLQVYNDIIALYKQLTTNSGGLVETETPMTLSLTTTAESNFTKATAFNVNVKILIKTNFPNMKIVTAPQFDTASGQLVRLKVDELQGQVTEQCSFGEKLRAFQVVPGHSAYSQKKMQSTNGAIIYRPVLIATMLGV